MGDEELYFYQHMIGKYKKKDEKKDKKKNHKKSKKNKS